MSLRAVLRGPKLPMTLSNGPAAPKTVGPKSARNVEEGDELSFSAPLWSLSPAAGPHRIVSTASCCRHREDAGRAPTSLYQRFASVAALIPQTAHGRVSRYNGCSSPDNPFPCASGTSRIEFALSYPKLRKRAAGVKPNSIANFTIISACLLAIAT